jgi:hypothetical protein
LIKVAGIPSRSGQVYLEVDCQPTMLSFFCLQGVLPGAVLDSRCQGALQDGRAAKMQILYLAGTSGSVLDF